MDKIEKYYGVYKKYPSKTVEDQRHYREFCKLLDRYNLDDIIHQAETPIPKKVNYVTDNNYQRYQINDITDELITSHLILIHELWGIAVPEVGWWPKGIKSQAKGMIRDYSKEKLHFFLHKLEKDEWYKQHIKKPFTFNMVRKYIERG